MMRMPCSSHHSVSQPFSVMIPFQYQHHQGQSGTVAKMKPLQTDVDVAVVAAVDDDDVVGRLDLAMESQHHFFDVGCCGLSDPKRRGTHPSHSWGTRCWTLRTIWFHLEGQDSAQASSHLMSHGFSYHFHGFWASMASNL